MASIIFVHGTGVREPGFWGLGINRTENRFKPACFHMISLTVLLGRVA